MQLLNTMHILNETRNTTMAGSARRANNFLARGRGLMFTPVLPAGDGLVIEPCNSIHMFFMRYPLDIVFLDKQGAVTFMYRGIKPWRVGRIVSGAHLAIELPEGVISASGTQLGDLISVD
ncbi:MAG: DUF192 domain-containing protein [Chloroflexota bacterium]|nr:DUF192 domain-containing protein [Chloroflexota bacterium]